MHVKCVKIVVVPADSYIELYTTNLDNNIAINFWAPILNLAALARLELDNNVEQQ